MPPWQFCHLAKSIFGGPNDVAIYLPATPPYSDPSFIRNANRANWQLVVEFPSHKDARMAVIEPIPAVPSLFLGAAFRREWAKSSVAGQ